jgi:hypothetical protein
MSFRPGQQALFQGQIVTIDLVNADGTANVVLGSGARKTVNVAQLSHAKVVAEEPAASAEPAPATTATPATAQKPPSPPPAKPTEPSAEGKAQKS